MRDKELRFVAKCVHCGKAKNMHRAVTLDCPGGKRTPTGYRRFGPHTFTPHRDDRSRVQPAEDTATRQR